MNELEHDKVDGAEQVLGRTVTYPQTYKPEVLVGIPRSLNRHRMGIGDDALPFNGCDIWHAYEASCLTDNGLPTAGMLKIKVPATSRCIVESKSLKLYLNSFNMEKMGRTAAEANERMAEVVSHDLTSLFGAPVEVCFFDSMAMTHSTPEHDDRYQTIEKMAAACGIVVKSYTESPDLLKAVDAQDGSMQFIKSHLLRSNCPVTHQPDWGTIYVAIDGIRHVSPASLLEYIVSLRGENHFHEEICELVFKRLTDLLAPDRLNVACRYTRRGGIDITPVRESGHWELWNSMTDTDILTERVDRM